MSSAFQRALLVLGCLLYIAGLQAAYVLVLAQSYAQRGFVYNPPPLPLLLLAWSFALAPALLLPVKISRPSQVVYWLLYLLVLVPACVVPLYSLALDTPRLLAQDAALLGAFALLGVPYLLPLPRLRKVGLAAPVYWLAVGLLAVGLGGYLVVLLGARLNLIPLLEVYAVRADYREALAQAGGPGADYAVHWLGYVLLPLLLAQGIGAKNWWLAGAAVLGELELYAMTGFKSMAFLLLLLAGVWLALWRGGRNFGPALVWGMAALAVAATVAALVVGEPLLAYFSIGRPVATPGLLTGYYFDFFGQHETAQLRHSILAGLGGYPYEATPPFVIGREYFGDATLAANANLFADGFANFGYAGLFGAAGLLGGLLWLGDALVGRVDVRVALVLAVAGFALANAGLLTTLLTHGLGLALLLIYFLPPRVGERKEEPVMVLAGA